MTLRELQTVHPELLVEPTQDAEPPGPPAPPGPRRQRSSRNVPVVLAAIVVLTAGVVSFTALRQPAVDKARVSPSEGLATENAPARSLPGSHPSRVGVTPAGSMDAPYQGPAWPALTYTLRAVQNGRQPAPFPTTVPGYRRRSTLTTRITVRAGRYFVAYGDLPVATASYDGCRRQRFYARWRAVDPTAVLESTFVDAGVHTVQNRPVRGAAGWQSSYGCVQPALRIPSSAPHRSAVVVLAEIELWLRS